jgi:uncharacterized alkaline shock family protein YloU
MTKFLHVLSGLVIWFLFSTLGVALIHANIPGVTKSLFDILPPLQSFKMTGVGGVIILISMLYLITFGPRRQKVRYISFDSDNGAVSISVSAVRDFIRKLGDEFGAVVGIDPKIRAEKDAISVDLDVKVQTGVRIPEFSQALQNRVREGMQDSLGIIEVKEVKVRIQEIVGTPRPPRR